MTTHNDVYSTMRSYLCEKEDMGLIEIMWNTTTHIKFETHVITATKVILPHIDGILVSHGMVATANMYYVTFEIFNVPWVAAPQTLVRVTIDSLRLGYGDYESAGLLWRKEFKPK